jgi:cytoskeletal protein CcmA (bactofilin family)
MFKKEDGISAGETIIANGVKVEGDFSSPGNVRIEGMVVGTVKSEGDLVVAESAVIEADVVAANASIAGELKGNLSAYDKVDLLSTARIYGNISCRQMSVETGASISGNCQISQQEKAIPARVREAKAAVEA